MNIFVLLSAFGLTLVLAISLAISSKMRAKMLENRLNRLVNTGGLVEAQGPLQWKTITFSLAKPLAGLKERTKLSQRLAAAGFYSSHSVNIFLIAKAALVVLTALVGASWLDLGFSNVLSQPVNTMTYLFLIFLAARFPDWWLGGQIKERRAKLRSSIPQAIDLMTICVESGLSLEDAFERVSREMEKTAREVAAEFRATRSEMLVMNRWTALRRMENRSGIQELGTMASSLLQSIQYGTPLAEALRAIAADCRANQLAALEEKAGSISAKIGIPLVLLILFPLVAMIAAPAVISLMRSFGG
ncbi:MAG: type II secretion system F family protein [Deltaproteobacteria bacterium]|jgi:tight adherence protein C|nr:type II secretion system F family protein [Deltaproteobacteria bacterium]